MSMYTSDHTFGLDYPTFEDVEESVKWCKQNDIEIEPVPAFMQPDPTTWGSDENGNYYYFTDDNKCYVTDSLYEECEEYIDPTYGYDGPDLEK